MHDTRRSYAVLSYEQIQALRVRDRLQLMEELWNSIFFGAGRSGKDVWFPLWDAVRHEFERRWPDEIDALGKRRD